MFRFLRFDLFAAPAPRLRLWPADIFTRMLWTLAIMAALFALLFAATVPARAQGASTIFLTDRNGQIAFPILPPNRATGAAGSIDNMAIGQTTPKPGSFTTLTSTSAPSGAGITALFASPPALGSVAPAAVNSTTFKSTDAVTCATYAPSGTPAATDAVFFIATRAYNIVSISAVFSVTAGGASKLQVTKDTGTAAPGAGTDILTNNTNTGFDLAATANTVQVGTFAATSLAAGDRLAVDYANAIQSTAGMVVTACLAPQ